VLLLNVSRPNLPIPHTGYVLLLSTVPNLKYQPTGHVLLLDLSQPNLQYQPARYVLLPSTLPNLPITPAGHVRSCRES
jgi:hypothetical protein